MSAEGVGRLFAVDKIANGPMPEHYEPVESPIDTNPFHPNVVTDPTLRIYKEDREFIGSNKEYPFVATTYRLTEHFHSWTAQSALNIIAQPQQFVEIGEKLAAEKRHPKGDMVKLLLVVAILKRSPWLQNVLKISKLMDVSYTI